MNTIFNKPYYKKEFFFLVIIILLLSGNSIAQGQDKGPFSNIPTPPPLEEIWELSFTNPSPYCKITMNSVSLFDTLKYDGIMVEFHLNTEDISNNRHLVSFWDLNYSSLSSIGIYYSNKSIFVRRGYKDNSNQNKAYYYRVYDQLFDYPAIYKIKLYVTANFIFIVTNELTTNNYYLSPIFFGLNPPDNNTMKTFLNFSNNAIIGIGSQNYTEPIFFVKLYAFSYNHLVGTDSQGKKVYEGLLPNIRAWIKQLYVN
jgi:hypothetical protein